MKAWIRTLRLLFFRLSTREKTLVIAIIAVLAISWASAELGSWRQMHTRFLAQSARLATQESWLKDRHIIESRLNSAMTTLDPQRTLNASALTGRVDEIARAFGLGYSISNRPSESNIDFDIHSIRLTLTNAEMGPLILFTQRLQDESPYLVIDAVNLSVNRSRPTQHNANFTISSFELKALSL